VKRLLPKNLHRIFLYAKYNIRDFYDSYIAPALSPRITPLGFVFLGSNSIHHKAMQKGEFESLEVEWLNEQFNSIDYFIDIGANIGYFSCIARSKGKFVIAVEPLWKNLQMLLRNIELNSGPPVEVFPLALSAEIGTMNLYGLSSTGASLLANWAGAPVSAVRRVPVTTLDNILGGRFIDKRLLIKIDVEGFEYQLLNGSKTTLDRKLKPVWLIEITNSQFHPQGLNPHFEDTFQEFWRRGYLCFALTSAGKEFIENKNFIEINKYQSKGVINYIFLDNQSNR